jgi:hypothetical protein
MQLASEARVVLFLELLTSCLFSFSRIQASYMDWRSNYYIFLDNDKDLQKKEDTWIKVEVQLFS